MPALLPDVSFGDGTNAPNKGAVIPDLAIDDDADMAQTPADVIAMLGFDPLQTETVDSFEESDHPRKANGEFSGMGETPIPAGMMRRYHVTPVRNLESIRKNGLQMSHSTGVEGPRAVYSWTKPQDAINYGGMNAESAIVEFFHDPKNYEEHPAATHAEVPPENIVGVHQQWHGLYNSIKSGRGNIDRLRKVAANKGNEVYKRALQELDKEANTTHDSELDNRNVLQVNKHTQLITGLGRDGEIRYQWLQDGKLYDVVPPGLTTDAAEFEESKHPRSKDGQFSEVAGSGASKKPTIPPGKEKNSAFQSIQLVGTNAGSEATAFLKIAKLQDKIDKGGLPDGGDEFAQQWIDHLKLQVASSGTSKKSGNPYVPVKPDGDVGSTTNSIEYNANDPTQTLEEKIDSIQQNIANVNLSDKTKQYGKEWINYLNEHGHPPEKDDSGPAKVNGAGMPVLPDQTDATFAVLESATDPMTDYAEKQYQLKQATQFGGAVQKKYAEEMLAYIKTPEGKAFTEKAGNKPKAVGGPSYTASPNWNKHVQTAMQEIQSIGDDPDMPYGTKIVKIDDAMDKFKEAMDLPDVAGSTVGNHGNAWIEHLIKTDGAKAWEPKPDAAKTSKPAKSAEPPLHKQQLPPLSVDWKKTGDKLGTNPGGTFTAANGTSKFYVKVAQDESHARNEQLASKLYELAESPVLPTLLVKGKDVGGNDNSFATASAWKEQTSAKLDSAEDKAAMQKNFAVHALLANWDAIGSGTLNQVKIDGVMTTIDMGGSLLYRAQGAAKGDAFTSKANEWDTMRSSSMKGEAPGVFGNMTDQQLFDSAKAVAKLDPDKVFNTVIQHGPGTLSARLDLADKILARRDDIVSRANKLGLGQVHKT